MSRNASAPSGSSSLPRRMVIRAVIVLFFAAVAAVVVMQQQAKNDAAAKVTADSKAKPTGTGGGLSHDHSTASARPAIASPANAAGKPGGDAPDVVDPKVAKPSATAPGNSAGSKELTTEQRVAAALARGNHPQAPSPIDANTELPPLDPEIIQGGVTPPLAGGVPDAPAPKTDTEKVLAEVETRAIANPEDAAAWVESFAPGPLREEAREFVAFQWNQKDPAKAAAWKAQDIIKARDQAAASR